MLDDGATKIEQPGLFYLPRPGTIPLRRHIQIRSDQKALDRLLDYIRTYNKHEIRPSSLFDPHDGREEDGVKTELAQILSRFAPRTVTKGSIVNHNKLMASRQDRSSDSSWNRWGKWIDTLVDHKLQIILLRPGELPRDDPSILGIVWEVEHNLDNAALPPMHTAERWSLRLQALLQKRQDPSFPLTRIEQDELIELILNIPVKTQRRAELVYDTLGMSLPEEDWSKTEKELFGEAESPLKEANHIITVYRSKQMSIFRETAQVNDDASGPTALCNASVERKQLQEELQSAKHDFLEEWWDWYCEHNVG
jgi:hypothetical protein